MSIKLPKKGLRMEHLNICSLRNKVYDLSSVLLANKLHIAAISETHVDSSIDDTQVAIQARV